MLPPLKKGDRGGFRKKGTGQLSVQNFSPAFKVKK